MATNQLIKGSLTTIILQLLSQHSQMYGYEITQKVKELSLGEIKVTEGALYPALHKLEAEGLLDTYTEVVDNRLRKYYKLSQKGKGVAKEKVNELEKFISSIQAMLNLKMA